MSNNCFSVFFIIRGHSIQRQAFCCTSKLALKAEILHVLQKAIPLSHDLIAAACVSSPSVASAQNTLAYCKEFFSNFRGNLVEKQPSRIGVSNSDHLSRNLTGIKQSVGNFFLQIVSWSGRAFRFKFAVF